MRVSSYTIPIKLEKEKDLYVLIHGYTGAIDLISSEGLTAIKNVENENIPNYALQKTLNRGYVTNRSKEEEYDYIKKVASVLHKRDDKSYKRSFTFIVSYDCNFRCPYCFEKSIINNSNKQGYTITKSLVDKAFQCMSLIEPQSLLHNNVIQLFGGEPLLQSNKEIVEYIVEKGSEKGFSFIATSNGYDLNYYQNLLKKSLIKGVQITIDGTAKTHNKRRRHKSGISTFEKIVSNAKEALNNNAAIKIRINIDEENIDELPSLVDFFEESGFYQYKKFSVYAEFISGKYNFNPEDYHASGAGVTRKTFFHVLDTLGPRKVEYDTRLNKIISNSIITHSALQLSALHCTAQSSSFIFDPAGDIYSCLEAVGRKNDAIGSYKNGLAWTGEKDKWFSRDISKQNKCSTCKYALLCGGGCFAKALDGDVTQSPCDDFPMRLERAVNNVFSGLKGKQLIKSAL